MRVLFSHDIPDPRDIVIISLADASGAFERLLSPAEMEQVRERIALVSRMDLIGRLVANAVRTSEAPVRAVPTVREIPVVRRPPLFSVLLGRAFILEQYRRLGPIFQIKKSGRSGFACSAGVSVEGVLEHGEEARCARTRSLHRSLRLHDAVGRFEHAPGSSQPDAGLRSGLEALGYEA